jgi:hypothetical protein
LPPPEGYVFLARLAISNGTDTARLDVGLPRHVCDVTGEDLDDDLPADVLEHEVETRMSDKIERDRRWDELSQWFYSGQVLDLLRVPTRRVRSGLLISDGPTGG